MATIEEEAATLFAAHAGGERFARDLCRRVVAERRAHARLVAAGRLWHAGGEALATALRGVTPEALRAELTRAGWVMGVPWSYPNGTPRVRWRRGAATTDPPAGAVTDEGSVDAVSETIADIAAATQTPCAPWEILARLLEAGDG